jgi:hypothetical protein
VCQGTVLGPPCARPGPLIGSLDLGTGPAKDAFHTPQTREISDLDGQFVSLSRTITPFHDFDASCRKSSSNGHLDDYDQGYEEQRTNACVQSEYSVGERDGWSSFLVDGVDAVGACWGTGCRVRVFELIKVLCSIPPPQRRAHQLTNSQLPVSSTMVKAAPGPYKANAAAAVPVNKTRPLVDVNDRFVGVISALENHPPPHAPGYGPVTITGTWQRTDDQGVTTKVRVLQQGNTTWMDQSELSDNLSNLQAGNAARKRARDDEEEEEEEDEIEILEAKGHQKKKAKGGAAKKRGPAAAKGPRIFELEKTPQPSETSSDRDRDARLNARNKNKEFQVKREDTDLDSLCDRVDDLDVYSRQDTGESPLSLLIVVWNRGLTVDCDRIRARILHRPHRFHLPSLQALVPRFPIPIHIHCLLCILAYDTTTVWTPSC